MLLDELLQLNLASLRNPDHCPPGVYVLPSFDNSRIWYGIIFVDDGPYSGAILKFRIAFEQREEQDTDDVFDHDTTSLRQSVHCSQTTILSSVNFLSDVFHPLVDPSSGQLQTLTGNSRPSSSGFRESVARLLFHIKHIFSQSALEALTLAQCNHKEALQMYSEDRRRFNILVHQTMQLSLTSSSLYDNYPEGNPMRFRRLGDTEYTSARQKFMP